MKHILLSALVACTLIAGTTVVSAQQNLSPTQAEVVTIKPKLKLGDVKAVANFIGGVDIKGNEVDAFIEVKKTLTSAAEAAAKAGKKDDDVITVDLKLDVAQNLFLLMQRASLKGAEAEKFKEITTSIQEAAKEAQKK
ncbi:MAG: hypothetical protein JSS89_11385 [Bacteroidetes bacterium]|nr:hypothetical protein [Bacteroidota bacterium]